MQGNLYGGTVYLYTCICGEIPMKSVFDKFYVMLYDGLCQTVLKLDSISFTESLGFPRLLLIYCLLHCLLLSHNIILYNCAKAYIFSIRVRPTVMSMV